MKSMIKSAISVSVITLGLLASSYACYYRAGVVVVRPLFRPYPRVVVVRPVPVPSAVVVYTTAPRYYVAPRAAVVVGG